MRVFIGVMIFAGSALMIYNIIRYALFIKRNNDLERQHRNQGLLIAPLVLLVFFLVGYIVIGFGGSADLMMAGILFGGSVFVFLMLSVMYSIVDRVRDTDKLLSLQYEDMKQELDALTTGGNATFRINLTKDEVEERHGEFLYESDLRCDSYTELLECRREHVIDLNVTDAEHGSLFGREDLLRAYQEGHTRVFEVVLVRRSDGEVAFVSFEATLARKPVSGDVVAFLIERPYQEEMVRQALLERVMMDEYDRISYLNGGSYHTLISNAAKKTNMLLTRDEDEPYETMYLNEILPAMPKSVRTAGPNPLRLSVIDKALAQNDTYIVELPFVIRGETVWKRFAFYCLERRAKFYLMLISDTTALHENQPIPPTEPEPEPAAPEAPQPEPEATPEEESVEASLAGLHVLAADDNAMNREIAELLLSAEGCTVDLAENGAVAVEKLRVAAPGTYDLILMDVHMPVMDGYAATAEIRRLPDPALAATPIVALSASDSREDAEAALAAGMDGYATKPLDLEQLRQVLLRLLPDWAARETKREE